MQCCRSDELLLASRLDFPHIISFIRSPLLSNKRKKMTYWVKGEPVYIILDLNASSEDNCCVDTEPRNSSSLGAVSRTMTSSLIKINKTDGEILPWCGNFDSWGNWITKKSLNCFFENVVAASSRLIIFLDFIKQLVCPRMHTDSSGVIACWTK